MSLKLLNSYSEILSLHSGFFWLEASREYIYSQSLFCFLPSELSLGKNSNMSWKELIVQGQNQIRILVPGIWTKLAF